MALQIRKAQRRQAKLRLALVGPTGSGKTYSALKMAFGLGSKVGLIDTEHGSGDLYADIGDYDIITLEPPFTVPKYREAIQAFEAAGHDVIIIDSLTHAWTGEGGLLDKQGKMESSGKYKSSFATWRDITPEHNKLIDEMLGSPSHIIATMRTKTEYVIEKDDRGKSTVRKVGLSPVQRDGMEYEFTIVMEVNDNHYASASKDRTSMFDGWSDRIGEDVGRRLRVWLESGAEPAPPAPPAPKPRTRAEFMADLEHDLEAAEDEVATHLIIGGPEVQKALEMFTNGSRERLVSIIDAAFARFAPASPPHADDMGMSDPLIAEGVVPF